MASRVYIKCMVRKSEIRLLVVAVRWVVAAFACHANETYETLKQLDTKSGQHVICSKRIR